MTAVMDHAVDLHPQHIAALLERSGVIPAGPLSFEPLRGGGNNRSYRVNGAVRPVLLKHYYDHPRDRRNRLGTEFNFLRFAWDAGIRSVPEPLGCDWRNRVGLYDFIFGHGVEPHGVLVKHVRAAARLTRELNRWRMSAQAHALPPASEACMCLDDHLGHVDRRVEALAAIEPTSCAQVAARTLIDQELRPRWLSARAAIIVQAQRMRLDCRQALEHGKQVLSPSDFGFHNALVTAGGAVRFIDFEYAGWDDPAKLLADFFNQVAVPVPITFLHEFAEEALREALGPDEAERCAERARMLMPAYRVKWVCLLLSRLLPEVQQRRRFAHTTTGSGESDPAFAEHQLQQARLLLTLAA